MNDFKNNLVHRFFIRFHMSLILSGVISSGVLFDRLLLHFNVDKFVFRYPASVLFSYTVFFILVRIWLAYVCPSPVRSRSSSDDNNNSWYNNWWIWPNFSGYSSKGSSIFKGKGGDSGGGGASDSWGDSKSNAVIAPAIIGSSSSNSSGGGLSDLIPDKIGDEGGAVIVLAIFALLVAVILGGGFYLIYAAPNLLSETAFQMALSMGIIKTKGRVELHKWYESLFTHTVIPFGCLLLLSLVLALVMTSYFPEAHTLHEILSQIPV
jgi:hypothetical protein